MMLRKPRILCLFLAFFASNVFAKNEPPCTPYPLSRVNIRHREHHGVGWDKGYSSFTAFVMPKNNLFFVPFLDARLHVFNDGDIASNLGVGARFAPKKNAPIVGLNVYYDFREYSSFSSHQASAGFEVLSSLVDFRASGYYPFSGKTKEEDVFFHTFKGNYALFKQEILYSLPCADAELGFFLPEPMKQIKLYLAAGGYYLFKQQALHHEIGNAPGFKARLSATPEDWISFNVEYTYDRLFKSRTNASINFNIPLGKKETPSKKKSKYQKSRDPCKSFYAFEERKSQDPYHNEIIPFYHEKHLFSPASSKTGLAHSFIFVNNTNLDPLEVGSGSGTFEDPYTTLKLGEENSKPYDIVYVFYGRGNDAGYNKGFNFQNEQLLTSGSVPIYIDGYFIPAFEPGLNPYVSNFKNTAFSTILAQNLDFIALQGFNLSSKTTPVVELRSVGAQIQSNTLNASSSFPALAHYSPFSGFILQNKFNQSGLLVINGYPAKNYSIAGNSFSYNGAYGIYIQNVAESIFITNNTFDSLISSVGGIYFTGSSYIDGLKNCNVIYRNNSTVKGDFTYGIYNEFDLNQPFNLIASNNDLTNGLIENGFFYLGYNDNSSITLSENNIKAAVTGVSIENHGANFLAKIEENNILTSQNNGSYGILYKSYDSASLSVLNNTSSSYAPLDITNYIPKIGLISLDIQKNNLISNDFILSIRNNGVGSTYGNILNNTQSFYSSAGFVQTSSIEANGGNICLNYSGNISLAKNSFLNLINQTPGTFQMATDAPPSRQSLYNQNSNIGINDTGYGPITYVVKGTPCPDIRPTFYVDSSSTKPNPDGSLQNPYHTITDAISHSQAGALIFVFPGNGYSEGVSLLDDQILASSGATFRLDGKQYTQSTARPIITNDGDKPIIIAQNNNSIYGFQFALIAGTDAITASSIENIIIDQNNFKASSSEVAIFLICNSPTITNNTFIALYSSNRFINANTFGSNSSTVNINNNSFTLDPNFGTDILLSNLTPNNSSTYNLGDNTFLTPSSSSKTTDFFFSQTSSTSNISLANNTFNENMTLVLNITQNQPQSAVSMIQNSSTGSPVIINIKEENSSILKFDNNSCLPKSQGTINADVTTSSCIPRITQNDYDFVFSPTAGSANVYFPNTQNYFQLTNQNPNGSFSFNPAVTPTYNTPCP